MKRFKYLASIMLCASLLFTGCASSFQEAIGNVTEEGLKRDSYLTYNGHAIDDRIGKLAILLEQLRVESSTMQSAPDKIYSNSLWTDDLVKNTKEGLIKNLKATLALYAHADELGVKLGEKEEVQLDRTVKTQLGQTYRNLFVEFLQSHGIEVNEQLIRDFLKMNFIADAVNRKIMETASVKTEVGKSVAYDQFIIQVSNNKDDAKATADKVKEELEKGKSVSDVANEFKVAKIDGVEVQDVPSTNLDQEMHDDILKSNVGDCKLYEFKPNGDLAAYYIIKITDIDSDATKQKAQSIQAPRLKEEAAKKQLDDWIKDVYVNQEKFDSFKFVSDKNFWEKYDEFKDLK